jgi:hypothetical protein
MRPLCPELRAPWARPEITADPPQAAQGTNDPRSLIRRRRIGESAIPAMIRPMKPSSKVATRGGDQHDHVHHVLWSGVAVRVVKAVAAALSDEIRADHPVARPFCPIRPLLTMLLPWPPHNLQDGWSAGNKDSATGVIGTAADLHNEPRSA